jgi:hypothetical protein
MRFNFCEPKHGKQTDILRLEHGPFLEDNIPGSNIHAARANIIASLHYFLKRDRFRRGVSGSAVVEICVFNGYDCIGSVWHLGAGHNAGGLAGRDGNCRCGTGW